jgi:HlyD family secretion protein
MDQQTSPVALNEFLGTEAPARSAKYRKWAIIALGVIGALLLGYWLFGGSGSAKSYATDPVTRGNLQVRVTATGNLAPTNEVSVGSEISGLVEKVLVDVNDRVVRGQVLAQIDTSRALDTIARSRAALNSAQAGVGQAQATLRQSGSNLSRLQEVYRLSGGKVPSMAELDIGRGDYARAVANVRAAQAQVASAAAQLSSDNTNLQKATIRSPVTGVVLSRQIEPGQTVAASFNTPTLFNIAEDLSAMKLEVKVDEADVGQVFAGQKATFTVDAFPGRSFPALITRVDVGANSTTATTASSSTVVSYTAVPSEQRNVLLVPNAALRFKPTVAKKSSGLGIGMGPPGMRQGKPKEAQIGRGTRQTVYVLGADNAPTAVQVVAGETNGSVTIVTGNALKAGDKVITGELAAAK